MRIHRSRTLTRTETTTRRGIPVTTAARTIIGLATTLDRAPLEQALDRADRRGLIDFAELKTRPIPRSLQAVVAGYSGHTFTRSELEDRFFALCDNHDLPRPVNNTGRCQAHGSRPSMPRSEPASGAARISSRLT
jgi:hypothetical protein